MKTWKKLFAGLFVFALILSCANLMSVSGSKVYAEEASAEETTVKYYVQSYTGTQVSAYKTADVAPVPTPAEGNEQYNDWIFAGWFTNETCETALGKTINEGDTYYAKYVPSEVLSVKAQVKVDTEADTEKTDMRLVATVDSLNHKSVGFEVYYNNATSPVKIKSTTVYSRIEAAKDGVEYGFSPNIFDTQSEYFVTATLKNIANKNFGNSFYIRPYWETLDGTTVYGVSRYARVEDSYLNIVNVPVRVVSDATTATEGTFNVTYDKEKFVYLDTYTTTLLNDVTTETLGYVNGNVFDSITVDGTTTVGTVVITGIASTEQKVNGEVAHLRLQVAKDANDEFVTLQKKNVFAITSTDLIESVVIVDSVYNYFGIAALYSGTADTSWYDANETEFVITTAEELYGLASLVNEGTFTTETVYLGRDIIVNEGTPEGADGVWGTGDDDWSTVAPTYSWTPIAKQGTAKFSGTFDGEGHTISGIYASQTYTGVGLFGEITTGAYVGNLKLTDSYFTSGSKPGAAAICGWYANGTFENIYSDAYVKTTADHAGGLTMGNSDKTLYKNCWFAGEVQGKNYVGGITGFAAGSDLVIESCLFTGKINVTSGQAGGILGRVTKAVIVNDTLSTGTVTINTSTTSGAIAGWVGTVSGSVGSVACNNSYSNSSKLYYTLQTASNTFTGAETVTELNGVAAYNNTELDFEEYWVIRQSATPVLKSWCESGALYIPKTDWTGSGTEEDPYIIKTAEHLYGLANSVNAGTTYEGKYFKLGANITVNSGTASRWEDEAPKYNWTPIGTGANQFKGNFNTNASVYSVKGLYAVKSVDTTNTNYYMGMFGNVNGAKIGNLKVLNSYFSASAYIGAVAGTAVNSEIDNVYSDAIIRIPINGGSIGGGIVGHMTTAGSISNAWYDGAIIANGRYLGGIVGIAEGLQTMDNCLFTGSIDCTNTSSNVYTGGLLGLARKSIKISDSVVAATNMQSTKTGMYASVLGSVSDSSSSAAFLVEYDNVYALDAIGNTTMTVGRTEYGGGKSSGSPAEVASLTGANAYLNTYLTFDRHEDVLPESEQHDGIWVAREGKAPGLKIFVAEEDRMELVNQNMYRADKRWYNTTDTEFTINNAEELVGFMHLVNANTSFAGKKVQLGADITLNVGKASDWYAGNGKEKLYNWIPIGNGTDITFSGTFDGKGYTISGVYGEHKVTKIGFFGKIADGSTVRDFKLINSFFTSNSNQCAAICGGNAGGTLDTIYTDAYVVLTGTAQHAGGIVSAVNAGTTIKNCWFAGTVKGNSTYVGGITSFIGATNVTIESCLNSGNVTGSSQVGGIVGRTGASTTIKDSLNVGTIKATTTGTAKTRVGAIIGWPATANTTATLENVYALGDSVVICPTQDNAAAAPGTFTGTYAGVADLTGANGFLNTWLTFDRPELPTPAVGEWVAISGGMPVLKSFVEYADGARLELIGQSMYRSDARWYDEEETEFTITTAEQLIGFANLVNGGTSFVDKTVILGADITMNVWDVKDYNNTEVTSKLYNGPVIGDYGWHTDYSVAFAGTFDGAGYDVKGLYIDKSGYSAPKNTASNAVVVPSSWCAGLFGRTNGATVQNVNVLNSYIEGAYYAAGIVGEGVLTIIQNVYTDAIINATTGNSGGITGRISGGTVKNAWFDGEITAKSMVGGISGIMTVNGEALPIMEDCLVTGKVTGTQTSNNAYIGGLTGIVQSNATITDCLVDAKSITASNKYCVGSVIGEVDATFTVTMTNTYAIDGNCSALITGAVGTHATKTVGTVSAAPVIAKDLNNYKGYMSTDLDFDNAWVAMEETAPRLQIFAPEEGRFDTTSWFTKTVADAEGNAVGTEANPYIIDSLADLYGFTKRVKDGNPFEGKYIKLTKSIEANTVENKDTVAGWATEAPYYVWTSIGTSSSYFKGTFDGGNNTISGLYEKRALSEKDKTLWYVGLFGFADGATIKNISVKDSYFYASYYVAGIVGWLQGNGIVDSAYSNATIQVASGHGGGIAGALYDATVQQSWYAGNVTGPLYVGGIVGFATGTTNYIYHSLTTGTIHGSNKQAAGIVGRVASTTTIEDCLSTSTVTSVNGNRGSVVGYVASGSLTMTSVYGYSASDVTNGATAISGGNASGLTVTGGTKLNNLSEISDTVAYNKLNGLYWTARVDDIPVPTVFAEAGDYAVAAAKGNTYAVDVELAGSGTQADPYEISTAEELYGFAMISQKDDFAGKYVELTNNITVNTATIDKDNAEAVYYDWYPIGNATKFAGTFIGNGYTISGLHKAYDATTKNIGLFATTADTSNISDFRITNTYFHYDTNGDSAKIGSVVGWGYGTIEKVYSDATLLSYGRGTGGIIGYSINEESYITISNCWFDGSVYGLKPGSSPYIGGIAAILGNDNATVSHCLVSGDVLGLDKRVGGIVGTVNSGALTMTDCLFSGNITGSYAVSGDSEYVGQLIGTVEATATCATTATVQSCYGVSDYTTFDIGLCIPYKITETTTDKDGEEVTTVVETINPVVNGAGFVSKKYDRLIGYAGKDASLDYTTYWTLTKEGTPVLKYFAKSADIYDGSQIDALLELDFWNSDNVKLSKAEDKGQGTYMLTISGSNKTAYDNYLAALEDGIFAAYGNDQSSDLNGQGVYNAVYTSANCGDSANDDWVVNVSYVDGTIYISIATGQPLSQHLKASSITSYSAEDGYTTSGLPVKFHMVEQKYYSASSYIIQLSNGHLIVIDGGIQSEAPYLMEYMESLVPEGKKPIIEAWVLSHGHMDHVAVMMGFVQNMSTYEGKVYLEGIYYSEPNDAIMSTYDDGHHHYTTYIERITSMFKTTEGKEAEIYRMYTGQKYTFDGVVMDVLLAQELITNNDYAASSVGMGGIFNESSTWNMFTINGKKLLTGGDAADKSKNRLINMYDTDYLTVDVFTLLHHGKNINRSTTGANDAFSNALTVTGYVLSSYKYDLRVTNSSVSGGAAGEVGWMVSDRINSFMNKNSKATYLYYGQGTSILTFGDTITHEILSKNDWVNDYTSQ